MQVTHKVEISYLMDKPPRKLVFELNDVPSGPDKLPAVLRSIALAVEEDQLKRPGDQSETIRLEDAELGDPSRPRYFHLATGLVQHCNGTTVQQRDRCKARLSKLVVEAGGNPDEIQYRAGIGPGLLGRR